MADVFVSYARHDKARVAPLVSALEAQGWSVWWDPEIVPGQEFDQQIDVELQQASAVLVVWTPHSVASRWVRGEARDAADRGILVPVRFDEAVLPIDVRAFHTIDLDDATVARGGPAVQEVLQALRTCIARRGEAAGASDAPAARPARIVQPQPATARAAICVLPFTNLAGDAGQQALSDGITEDIITELSRWRFLAVRSRSASFRFRGDAVDTRVVARELDVRFIVEGSVRRIGERVRITAQLIDTGTGDHIWADKYDRDLAGGFHVQDEVVRTIVSTLVGRIQVAHAERARRDPDNLAAYEYVLKGNAMSWDEPEGLAAAKGYFQQAVALDPGYGVAHALLAAVAYEEWRNAPEASPALLEQAHALARRAVELDANDSTCFSILAQICVLQRSYAMALQHMRRAIEINPNNQWNNADMGVVLVYLGEPEEALEWFRRAREIDPFFDQPWYWRAMALARINLHQYAEALALLEHVAVHHYRTDAFAAACHARLGQPEQAAACLAACLAARPGFSIRDFLAREPFQREADTTHLAEALRMAGFPP